MCINYTLLGFYLCYFRKYECVKRLKLKRYIKKLKKNITQHITMSDLTITELRLIAKNRNIKEYKGLSKDELLKDLNIPVKTIKEIELSSLSLSELKLIADVRRIKNYKNKSKNELLDAFEQSEPFKGIKEIRKENRDENEIVRDLRVLYELKEGGEDYFEPQRKVLLVIILSNMKAMGITIKDYLLKIILI